MSLWLPETTVFDWLSGSFGKSLRSDFFCSWWRIFAGVVPGSEFGSILYWELYTHTWAFYSSAKGQISWRWEGTVKQQNMPSKAIMEPDLNVRLAPVIRPLSCALRYNYQLSCVSQPHKGPLWSCPSHRRGLSTSSFSTPVMRWEVGRTYSSEGGYITGGHLWRCSKAAPKCPLSVVPTHDSLMAPDVEPDWCPRYLFRISQHHRI